MKPGNGAKSEAVHSQTLPAICRQPKALSPSGQAATSSGASNKKSRLACWRVGAAPPHGQDRLTSARRLPSVLGSPIVAASHSDSVGSRRRAQRHQASASYQLTKTIGASGPRTSVRSYRRHVQTPSDFGCQYTGRSVLKRSRHCQPGSLQNSRTR